MEIKDLETKLSGIESEIKKFIDKHAEEMKASGTATTETKAALEKLGNEWKETFKEASARLLVIEQKMTAPNGGGAPESKTAGEIFTASEGFKSVQAGHARSGPITVGSFHKTNIVNATGQNQPLVPQVTLPRIIMPGIQRLTIRDLLPSVPTSGNLIQFPKENVFTNAAAMQTSEGAAKAESALTFTLANAAVQTMAHFIPASRQILDDAPALAGYINTRLMYGLKLIEEGQLLNGNGTGTNLSGLITNATSMSTAYASTGTDTYIDTILHAKTQLELQFFMASGLILNPRDWESIQLTKTTGSASSGEYIFANPHAVTTATIWGMPVVSTPSMTQGQFLVGDFNNGATIWDRQDASIEISREHSDFFTRNLVAILCEERLALTVYNSAAFVYGGFPFGS